MKWNVSESLRNQFVWESKIDIDKLKKTFYIYSYINSFVLLFSLN